MLTRKHFYYPCEGKINFFRLWTHFSSADRAINFVILSFDPSRVRHTHLFMYWNWHRSVHWTDSSEFQFFTSLNDNFSTNKRLKQTCQSYNAKWILNVVLKFTCNYDVTIGNQHCAMAREIKKRWSINNFK